MTARNFPSFAGAKFQHLAPSDKCAHAYTHEDVNTHVQCSYRYTRTRSMAVTVTQLPYDSHCEHVDAW